MTRGAGRPDSRTTAPAQSLRVLRPRVVLPIVVLLSFVLRVAYFVELRDGPCVRLHLDHNSDMNLFDGWARLIAGGDWLTDRSLHPLHDWHKIVAALHFGGKTTLESARKLWDHWYGGKQFHQEPLYPYFVALVYRLLGADPCRVFAVQLVLGVVSNVLIYWIARRYFGDAAAAAAGLLAVFCGPLLYYEMKLVRTSLTVLAALVLVCLTDLAVRRRTWRWWLLAGAAIGLAITLRMTFILFAGVILVVLLAAVRRQPAESVRRAGALLAGLLLGFSPVIARNLAVGAPPLSLASVGAVTFVMSNTVNYPPARGPWMDVGHVARIMGESDGRFLPAVLATLRTHPDVDSYVRLVAGKLAAVFHWYEQPNNANFYFFRLHAAALRYAWVTFAVVGPLGVVGIGLALPRLKATWPLYAMVPSLLATMCILWVVSRFRAPLLAILIPFAGLAVAQVVTWVLDKRLLPALVAVCAVTFLAVWVSRPLPPDIPVIRPDDYQSARTSEALSPSGDRGGPGAGRIDRSP